MTTIEHAASQPTHPRDGLPPGPWTHLSCGTVLDANGKYVAGANGEAIATLIARYGAIGPRRLFAACDVSDRRLAANSVSVFMDGDRLAVDIGGRDHDQGIICWLTPRNRP